MSLAEESPVPGAGTSASVALFLRRVADRGLCRPGTADYLRVEKLLASREQWTVDGLAAALAVETLGLGEQDRELLEPGNGEPEGGSREGQGDAGGVGVAPLAAADKRAWWWRLAPAGLLVLATLAIGILVPLLWHQEPVTPAPSPPPTVAETPEETESGWRLKPLEPERVLEGSIRPSFRQPGWRDALAFAASFVLLTLALRWWYLPEASRRRRQQALDDDLRRRVDRREDERRRGYAEREELARELLEAGRSPLVPFQVPELPAVSLRAIDDAAVVLARLQEEVPGHDLDAEATVAATVEAGGRAVPVYERGRFQATLLVLVDDEGGDHPWLGGFERVLDRWQKRGVRLLRFTFCEQPDPVTPYPRGAAISFDVLSRRHAGLPLLIFSRRLTHRGPTAAGADWTRRLEVWPVKTWIDPDPSPLAEPVRRPGFAQDAAGLKRLGFARFGLDEADLPVLARYLAEAGTGIAPPRRRPLPEITPEVSSALRAWAVAAARVPEAGWDLVEHFRRELHDEIGRFLPERRHVALLIRWLNARQGTPSRRHQAYLEIEDEEVERLRREQVTSDRARPFAKRLLSRVAHMLLEQLEATRPGEELRFLELRWRLKRAELELVASPDRALELLARFRGSAVDSHAARAARALLSEGSLEEEQREAVIRVWHPEREERHEAGTGVAARELLRGQPALWRRGLTVAGVALAVGLLGGLASTRWAAARDLTAGVREVFLARAEPSETDVLPRTRELVRSVGLSETDYRPALIEISAGSFTMGSPETEEGRWVDEKQHPVTLTRDFYLARTEVTQGQYQAVMGSNPSSDSRCGEDCPVENVSWLDAVRYANRLSELEDLETCYEISGEEVSWPRGLGCGGYRLPTEAEWEFAARSGTSDRYAGTDDDDDICRVGNVADAAGKKSNPTWTTMACDDGYARLAPVASFAPNGYRLYDMSGNVFEWVWDWLDDYDDQPKDPLGPEVGRSRVVRGGSFALNPRGVRVAFRFGDLPSRRNSNLGFRVARSLQ